MLILSAGLRTAAEPKIRETPGPLKHDHFNDSRIPHSGSASHRLPGVSLKL